MTNKGDIMGLFSIFKRKKKEKIQKLSVDDQKWNKLWDLWCDGKIESPYSELMEYLNGVNNGGHSCHLDNIAGNGDLKKYVDNLKLILPEPLKSNIELAYNAYIKNPDDISDEYEKILDSCDDCYYKNEELVMEIIKKRAEKVEL